MYKYFMSNCTSQAYRVISKTVAQKLVGGQWTETSLLPEDLVNNQKLYTRRHMIHAGKIEHSTVTLYGRYRGAKRTRTIDIQYYFVNTCMIEFYVEGQPIRANYKRLIQ